MKTPPRVAMATGYSGPAYWMRRVLRLRRRILAHPTPDAVHDLRTTLRRCRTLAEGMARLDPDGRWDRMRRDARRLFERLGHLRDVQVRKSWIHALRQPGEGMAEDWLAELTEEEHRLSKHARRALKDFPVKRWKRATDGLERRWATRSIPNSALRLLALNHLEKIRQLHRSALSDRSRVAWHRLRVGLKRFRYFTENFLPDFHRRWGAELAELQDLLGEMHDLDGLSAEVRRSVGGSAAQRMDWRLRLERERRRRVGGYRSKTTGSIAKWEVWRRELTAEPLSPQPAKLTRRHQPDQYAVLGGIPA